MHETSTLQRKPAREKVMSKNDESKAMPLPGHGTDDSSTGLGNGKRMQMKVWRCADFSGRVPDDPHVAPDRNKEHCRCRVAPAGAGRIGWDIGLSVAMAELAERAGGSEGRALQIRVAWSRCTQSTA